MFTASAEFYDTIYAGLKDYSAEADHLAALIRSEHPACRTVLDVGCGIGEHVRQLCARGFTVDGLDIDAQLLRVAIAKNPGRRFHEADMCDFRIDARYDGILCLFSSIGYARTLTGVTSALTRFRGHLAEGGIVVVEPWFTPDAIRSGHTTSQIVERPPFRIARLSRTEVVDRLTRITFDYDITGPDGSTHASEHHELGLFTVDGMKGAFKAAGLATSYDPVGLTGRGLYVARAQV